jgi:hypothetical protein
MAAWRRVWAGASSALLALALAAACNEPLAPPGGKPHAHEPAAPGDARIAAADAVTVTDAGLVVAPADGAPVAPADAAAVPFYLVTEALADAKVSPLKRLGIGAWPGNFSIKGCVYRNDRVFVVDVYCTYKEQLAFSVVVISPSKGEVRVYAEANDPISTVSRADYFTFYAETYPPALAPPALATATFDQVTSWQSDFQDDRRLPDTIAPCSTDIETCADPAWLSAAHAFIDVPTEDWTWIIDQLRNRAQHDGKYVAKKAK